MNGPPSTPVTYLSTVIVFLWQAYYLFTSNAFLQTVCLFYAFLVRLPSCLWEGRVYICLIPAAVSLSRIPHSACLFFTSGIRPGVFPGVYPDLIPTAVSISRISHSACLHLTSGIRPVVFPGVYPCLIPAAVALSRILHGFTLRLVYACCISRRVPRPGGYKTLSRVILCRAL